MLCRFESWVGQTAKVLSASYIAYKAGGPKDAYFSKEAQEELHTAQTVGAPANQNIRSVLGQSS